MRRAARLAMTGLLCALASGGVMAADAAATTGDLTQKPGVAGCWCGLGSCSPGTALGGAGSVTVSPDGRSAYVASQARGARRSHSTCFSPSRPSSRTLRMQEIQGRHGRVGAWPPGRSPFGIEALAAIPSGPEEVR
jgi:hypothetical protein